MTPKQYFTELDLWDFEKLKIHAEEKMVWIKTSERFPGLVLLHYKDEAQYTKGWNIFNRFCRGLIVDMVNKKILAHGFNKFHNLGEVPETDYNELLSLGGFQTSEKLDGSCIILFKDPNTNKLTFTTKGSFDSEHGAYVNNSHFSQDFWDATEKYNFTGTLIFELITKRFQIVIDYTKKGYTEGLYLIGYRYNSSNRLASFKVLEEIAKELNIPTFKTYPFGSLDQLIDTAKTLPVLEEGYVLRFENDLMVKVKGDAYLEMHRFISHLSDRNILEAVANDTADKLASLCPEEYKDEVLAKIEHFKRRHLEVLHTCYNYYLISPKETRKIFALWVNTTVEKLLRGFLFQLFENKTLDKKYIFKVIEELDNVDGRTRI